MIKISFYCMFIVFFVPNVLSQNASDMELQEAFKFSNIVISTIDEYIRDALPQVAKAEGVNILHNVEADLLKCESNAKTSRNIDEYKTCSSLLLRNAMEDLGGLQAKYRPFSAGASRMALLWW